MTDTENPSTQTAKAPAAPPASIEIGEPAIPASVATLRHRACSFGREHGAGERILESVALAVSEAVTNVVKYAYDRGQEGSVRLAAQVEDGLLEIRIVDEGSGFREGSSGGLGLGLGLIAQVSARLEIAQSAGATELRMSFPLDASG